MTDDVFRKEHRQLTTDEEGRIYNIKEAANNLLEAFWVHKPEGAREMALAKTNLEQAVMWAVKAISS